MAQLAAPTAPEAPATAPSVAPSTAPLEQPGGTAVLEREPVLEPAEPGDHERFAHYVRKEKILESAMTGEPVVALCGKTWVPGRDPERFPVCPTCKEIYDGLRPDQSQDSGSAGGTGSGSRD